MQIVCPNCATRYDVQPAAIGADGRSVRCARCRTVWHATPEPEPAVVAAADDATSAADAPAAEGGAAGEFDWSLGGEEGGDNAAPAGGAPSEPMGEGAADDRFGAGDKTIGPDQAPSVVPAIEGEIVSEPHAAAEPENIEAMAARRAPKAKKARRKFSLPRPGVRAAIVLLAIML